MTLRKLLEEAAVRMTYTSDSLAQLFADNFAGYFFLPDQPFDRQFHEMTLRFKDFLKDEDIRLLDDFAKDLGTGDIASEQKHIRMYIELLDERCEDARAEALQKGKLYRILPLSAGIASAVLLV